MVVMIHSRIVNEKFKIKVFFFIFFFKNFLSSLIKNIKQFFLYSTCAFFKDEQISGQYAVDNS